ncbi:hypothetical protein D3C85_1764570 [compost metagenome]
MLAQNRRKFRRNAWGSLKPKSTNLSSAATFVLLPTAAVSVAVCGGSPRLLRRGGLATLMAGVSAGLAVRVGVVLVGMVVVLWAMSGA